MKNNQMNPFVIGKYVSSDYFCDREKETEMLLKQVRNGRNVTLISDRRIGKSGLISHLFAQPAIQKQYYTIIVDLYATSSLAELVCMFGKEVYRSIQQASSWKEKFFQIISAFRVGFKLDPISGSPTFDIGIGDITAPNMTLEQVFGFLEQADKPCIVAFDEFQQIAEYDEKNIEALLRTYIQRCKKTQFIFAGSRKHLMTQMFLSPSKPFYQSTINLGLEPIPVDVYSAFAQQMFEKGSKSIASETVGAVYDLCRGITWYMQVLLNEMYELTREGEICPAEYIETAMQNVIRVQEPFYLEMLAKLPPKQKSVLFAVISEGEARNITSQQFISKHKLALTSSVQTAMRALQEKDIVVKNEDIYRVYDVFFAQYVKKYVLVV
jgi:AAA+ ATPase superfamily predicted ATPase